MTGMREILKQILSFILPVTVLILIPFSIENNLSIKNRWFFLIGLVIICLGLMVMILTITLFIREGKGTLAPWDPPKKLVTIGIYNHVRNPMILGVLTALLGESIAILSLKIGLWTLGFFIINHVYFIMYEEPCLERRFGAIYKEYKENVPRWIPAIKKLNRHRSGPK
jgi:protein-S-isoprenylcysteine O-methyltransferase Ste14